VVDKQGIDEAQYQQDLTDCRAVADEVSTGRDAAEGAAGKAGDAEQEKSQVVKNCMRGRGYRVLN
jgi:outer membrane lipoprotein SlyB